MVYEIYTIFKIVEKDKRRNLFLLKLRITILKNILINR